MEEVTTSSKGIIDTVLSAAYSRGQKQTSEGNCSGRLWSIAVIPIIIFLQHVHSCHLRYKITVLWMNNDVIYHILVSLPD